MADNRTKPGLAPGPESWGGKTFLPVEDESRRTGGSGPPMPMPGQMPAPMPPRLGPARVNELPRTTMPMIVRPSLSNAPPPSPLDHQAFRQFLDPRLVLLSDHAGPRAAAFRVLRDALVGKSAPKTIVVASSGHHEGKTTCAINLALALRERPAQRVLLLDGNFFAPSLGPIFHIDGSTRPAQEMSVPWLVPYRIAEVVDGFHVGALLTSPEQPTPAFNSRWYDRVLAHVTGVGYDYIVIDGASLDGSAATMQMVSTAGGTILTAIAGTTTGRSLKKAAAMIPEGLALGVTLIER